LTKNENQRLIWRKLQTAKDIKTEKPQFLSVKTEKPNQKLAKSAKPKIPMPPLALN